MSARHPGFIHSLRAPTHARIRPAEVDRDLMEQALLGPHRHKEARRPNGASRVARSFTAPNSARN